MFRSKSSFCSINIFGPKNIVLLQKHLAQKNMVTVCWAVTAQQTCFCLKNGLLLKSFYWENNIFLLKEHILWIKEQLTFEEQLIAGKAFYCSEIPLLLGEHSSARKASYCSERILLLGEHFYSSASVGSAQRSFTTQSSFLLQERLTVQIPFYCSKNLFIAPRAFNFLIEHLTAQRASFCAKKLFWPQEHGSVPRAPLSALVCTDPSALYCFKSIVLLIEHFITQWVVYGSGSTIPLFKRK